MSLAPDGALFDYFTGREDLAAGRVRFVGDPDTRLAEDYLRAMTDYFVAEAATCADPDARMRECFQNIALFEERLRAAGPVDGLLLDLHGAMVAEHVDDGEGELLARLRAVVGPDIPIAASLNRGLWLGLCVVLAYLCVVLAASGRLVALWGTLIVVAVAAAVFLASPLSATVTLRLETPHSNERRGTVAEVIAAWRRGEPLPNLFDPSRGY